MNIVIPKLRANRTTMNNTPAAEVLYSVRRLGRSAYEVSAHKRADVDARGTSVTLATRKDAYAIAGAGAVTWPKLGAPVEVLAFIGK